MRELLWASFTSRRGTRRMHPDTCDADGVIPDGAPDSGAAAPGVTMHRHKSAINREKLLLTVFILRPPEKLVYVHSISSRHTVLNIIAHLADTIFLFTPLFIKSGLFYAGVYGIMIKAPECWPAKHAEGFRKTKRG